MANVIDAEHIGRGVVFRTISRPASSATASNSLTCRTRRDRAPCCEFRLCCCPSRHSYSAVTDQRKESIHGRPTKASRLSRAVARLTPSLRDVVSSIWSNPQDNDSELNLQEAFFILGRGQPQRSVMVSSSRTCLAHENSKYRLLPAPVNSPVTVGESAI